MDALSEKRHAQSLSEAVMLALSDLDGPADRERAIDEASVTADPDGLVGLISVDDAIRRNAALEALSRGGQRSVPALVRALSDPDPEVVMFAAQTLGKTRDAAAVPHLIRVLRHEDINVCQGAIESLGMLRAAASLGELEKLLQGDPWIRFSVVHTIGEIGHPSSIRTLLRLVPDKDLHDNAVGALAKIGGPDAIGELARLLEAATAWPEFRTRLIALGLALTQIADPIVLQSSPAWVVFARSAARSVGPRLIQALRQGTEEVGMGDVQASKEAAIDVIRCLRLQPCYSEMIAAAAPDPMLGDPLLFAAADIGADIEPQLVEALAHADRHVRLFACRAMAAMTAPKNAGAAARLLTDRDEEVRAAAVRVLARLHSTDSLGDMLGRLDDASAMVKVAVLEGLGRMDAAAVTTAILRSPQLGKHRSLMLAIMRESPHPTQRSFLETCLADADEGVRQAAVAALVGQPATDLAVTLAPLLADRSVKVRREVIAALGTVRSEQAWQGLLGVIERDGELRGDAMRALRRVGDDRVIPKLMALYATFPATDQALAVDTLGALGAPSTEPFLARQLAHPDPAVRCHVVSALARIGSTPALRRLGLVLRDSDPRVRLTLSRALASCPHPIARSALERLSLDPVANVAAAARGAR